jgi:hypothetical protein
VAAGKSGSLARRLAANVAEKDLLAAQ